MKKYSVNLNGSLFSISHSIANDLINSDFNFQTYVENNVVILILNEINISYIQLTPTTSSSRFYILLSEKKYRINKQLYVSLCHFITRISKSSDNKKIVKKNMLLADLFSGTGGIIHASKELPIINNFSIDSCVKSKKIFEANFQNKLTNESISTIDTKTVPDHDILFAGFPCQPYSIAGERKGLSDIRSSVFNDILKIAKVKKPRFMVLENVKHLKSINQGKVLLHFINLLHNLGFFIKVKILNTSKITGIPQNRERLFIFCFAKKSDFNAFNFKFPEIENQHISKFLDEAVPSKYYIKKDSVLYKKFVDEVREHVRTGCVYQYRRSNFRRYVNIVPTLTASMGTGGHNVPLIKDYFGIRKLTPRECFRLQGFSDNYTLVGSDSTLYKLAGNAITVVILELILKRFCSIFFSK